MKTSKYQLSMEILVPILKIAFVVALVRLLFFSVVIRPMVKSFQETLHKTDELRDGEPF